MDQHEQQAPEDAVVVLYNHHGVIVKKLEKPTYYETHSNSSFISFVSSGSLNIFEQGNERWLEWTPEERNLSVESDPTEWEVVNTVKPKPQTSNESSAKKIKITINELKSLELRRNSHKMYFNLKDGTTYDVVFQHGDARQFISSFRGFAILERSRRTRYKYYVQGCVNKELTKSFAELDLFGEQGNLVARFMKDLHDRPFETTLTAFSKLTGAVASGINGSLRPYDEAEGGSASVHTAGSSAQGDEYEVISSEPEPKIPLPPRPNVQRSTPLSVDEWMRHIEEDGSVGHVDSLLRIIFRGGVEPELRYDVWKYLLNYIPYSCNQIEAVELRNKKIQEYHTLCQQWQSMTLEQEERFSLFRDRKSLIMKDVNRTDRNCEYFAGEENPHLDSLNNILMSYMMYNFDLGYVQGMSDLLSPILMLMNNEADAFWCFAGFMDKVVGNFMLEQTSMKEQLQQLACLLQVLDPQLATYLNAHESGNLFFCFRWLLVLFKREFSNEDIMIIWEVLWTGLPCPNFHLLLCISILEIERDAIMSNDNGLSDILAHVNSLALNIDREKVLCLAEALYLQLLAGSEKLPLLACKTLGMPLPPALEGGDHLDEHLQRTISPHHNSDDDEAFERALSHSFL